MPESQVLAPTMAALATVQKLQEYHPTEQVQSEVMAQAKVGIQITL